LKFVQTQKLFKLKIVQTQKLFKFENYSYFEFMQIRNCLKNEKPKKQPNSKPGKKKNRKKKTENIEPCAKRAVAHIPPPAGGAC
jgi:hypothetical protein